MADDTVYDYDPMTNQQITTGYWKLTGGTDAAICKLPAGTVQAYGTQIDYMGFIKVFVALGAVFGAMVLLDRENKNKRRGSK